MPCNSVTLPNGTRAIVCTTSPKKRCVCGGVAGLLCDWKVPARRSGTCDRPICAKCSHAPAPGKDLCPEHAAAWKRRQASRTISPIPPTTSTT